MTKLQAHFDGTALVLDQAAPPELKPNTPIEVVVLGDRRKVGREFTQFGKGFWSRFTLGVVPPDVPQWKRELLQPRHE